MDLIRGAGGAAAIVAAATLLVGIAGTVPRGHRVRPWLVTLLQINTGRIPREALRGVAPVDVVLLVLTAVAYAGFWPGPTEHRWWMVLAIAQPLLGIPLLLATRLTGRSGLMGGGIVLSILMLADRTSTAPGWWGLATNLLLFAGDVGTTGRPSRLRAALLTAGYCALIAWFGWLAVLLIT